MANVGERDRIKAGERNCVVPHSAGDGYYCVRTGYVQADGTIWIPAPYTHVKPVAVRKRESAATLLAEQLNGDRGGLTKIHTKFKLGII